jgi:hypothetical protein
MNQTHEVEAAAGTEATALPAKKPSAKRPVVHCPVCNERAHCRTSEEVTPTMRLLYYRCSNLMCSMSWRATLELLNIISPSGISPDFRPAHVKEAKPPGHEFGQAPLLEYLAAITPPT